MLKIIPSTSLDVYNRIRYNATNDLPLSPDEREKLEEMLIENYTERITRLNDEMLCQEALDAGTI